MSGAPWYQLLYQCTQIISIQKTDRGPLCEKFQVTDHLLALNERAARLFLPTKQVKYINGTSEYSSNLYFMYALQPASRSIYLQRSTPMSFRVVVGSRHSFEPSYSIETHLSLRSFGTH